MAAQLEQVRGEVEAANPSGIKVGGQWFNFSRFHPILEVPSRGQTISATAERNARGAYLRSLDIVGSAAADETTGNYGKLREATDLRDSTSTRLAVLQAAATFCGHFSTVREDVTSRDVLKIADAWLAWVEN